MPRTVRRRASSSSTSTRRAWPSASAAAKATGRGRATGSRCCSTSCSTTTRSRWSASTWCSPSATSPRACACWSSSRRRSCEGVPQFQAALEELKPQLDYDGLFAQSMKDRAVVLGYTFSARRAGSKGVMPGAGAAREASSAEAATDRRRWNGLHRQPARVLRRTPPRAGHFNPRSTTTASRAACRCSRNTTAATTSRCRSRWCGCMLGLAAGRSRIAPERRFGAGYPGLEWLRDRAVRRFRSTRRRARWCPTAGSAGQLRLSLARRRAERAHRRSSS